MGCVRKHIRVYLNEWKNGFEFSSQSIYGLFGWTETPYWRAIVMPHHFNCCVPGCFNSFRNSPELQFYRIPKDKGLRKTYKVILMNETLKLDSQLTRICSSHFEGGTKLSRSHLPSIFPWSKEPSQRRVLKRHSPQKENIQVSKKAKATKQSTDLKQQPPVEIDPVPDEQEYSPAI